MTSLRFDIVVANYCRATSFTENFGMLRGFNPSIDRVLFFDCSPEDRWAQERAEVLKLNSFGLHEGKNLFFIRRGSWNGSHGAQLDYFRLLIDGRLPQPSYTFFIQDHYLDLKRFVQEDTIPEGFVVQLDEIARIFQSDPRAGCCFLTRNGVRVRTTSSPQYPKVYGDYPELLPGSREVGLLVDGFNCAVRPEFYLPWMKARGDQLTAGRGTYPVMFVWEVRLGNILYQQGVTWYDLRHRVSYSTVEELRALETVRGEQFSRRWYDHRLWFFLHGRDLVRYRPIPVRAAVKCCWHSFVEKITRPVPRYRLTVLNPSLPAGEP